MANPCTEFVHFDTVYRSPDRIYLSNRRPNKRLCQTCGLVKSEHGKD